MPSARPTSDKIELDVNASRRIGATPEFDPLGEGYWWTYIDSQGQPALEFMDSSAVSGIFDQAPVRTNMATAIEPGILSIAGERVSRDKLLSDKIHYRNDKAVDVYLTRHPGIMDFIKAAWPALTRCFGKPVDIVLEVMTYPEEAPYEELVGWIQSTDDVYVGLEKFERFEDEWFLDHLEQVGDRFNFNIETK